MHHLKRITVALVLATLFIAPAWAEEKIEIQLWHHWTGHRTDWVQKQLDDFMAMNPDIVVTQMASGTGGAVDRLTNFIISGAAPEIVMVSSAYAHQFMAFGGLLELDELLARDGIDLAMYNDGDMRGFQLMGSTYGLPVMSGAAWTNLMFYNKDMLAEVGLPDTAPATWSEWGNAARRMTKKDGDGVTVRAGTTIPPIHVTTFWNGNQLWSDDWREATVGGSRLEETVDFLTRLSSDVYGAHANYNRFINSGVTFMNEDYGLWFQNNSAFGFMKDVKFNWGAALAPVNDAHEGTEAVGLVTSTWGYAIPATLPPHKVEAAWKVLKYLATVEEGAGWFARIQGRPSPVIDFNRHPDYIYENPQWPVVIEAVMNDIPAPPVNLWDMLVPISDQVLNENIHPQQAFQEMELVLQNALNEYWETLD